MKCHSHPRCCWVWAGLWAELQVWAGCRERATGWRAARARTSCPQDSPSPQTPSWSRKCVEECVWHTLEWQSSSVSTVFLALVGTWRKGMLSEAEVFWAAHGSDWLQCWADSWACCQSCGGQSTTVASYNTLHLHLGHSGWSGPRRSLHASEVSGALEL